MLEKLLTRWTEQHLLYHLPVHSLCYTRMKLLYILGKESQIPQLMETLDEENLRSLMQGIQDMAVHAFDKAIPRFEQVADSFL